MPQPLDYFNPLKPDEPAARSAAPRPAPAAIPIEFDVLLTQTADHAAARAVEVELARHGVAFFRTEGTARADRPIELHVRGADFQRASQLAASIFARRKRLDTISPRRKPPDVAVRLPGIEGTAGP